MKQKTTNAPETVQKKRWNVSGLQWIAVAVIFFVAVITMQQYILFEMEQSRVLVYESSKIMETLTRAGGIADFIALFLQQFFLFKVASAAIMATLFVVLSLLLHKVYRMAVGRSTGLTEDVICCLPAALMFIYTEDRIFYITGHVAIVLATLGLVIGAWLASKKNIIASLFLPLLVIFMGFAASTAAWPMVIGITLFALLYKRNYIAAALTVAAAALTVALGRYFCLALTNNELYSPDIFSYRANSPTIMPWIWAAIIAIVVLPLIVKKFVPEKFMRNVFVAGILAAAIVGMTYNAYNTHHDKYNYETLALQRWLDTEDYAPALEYCSETFNNIYTNNIYFMIRSFNNDLENEVGGVLKDGRQLIMSKSSVRYIRRHLMSLYYYLGYVNGAQREAFEYNEPSEGMMMPAALKILAKTNIEQGNYAAAEKYINYLDHTMFYSDWAKQYRRFLYDDKAVEKDPELGPRRRAMNIESVPQTFTTLPHIIRQIAFVAPELPAENYKKAFLRLGEYNKTQNETPQHTYIQY